MKLFFSALCALSGAGLVWIAFVADLGGSSPRPAVLDVGGDRATTSETTDDLGFGDLRTLGELARLWEGNVDELRWARSADMPALSALLRKWKPLLSAGQANVRNVDAAKAKLDSDRALLRAELDAIRAGR